MTEQRVCAALLDETPPLAKRTGRLPQLLLLVLLPAMPGEHFPAQTYAAALFMKLTETRFACCVYKIGAVTETLQPHEVFAGGDAFPACATYCLLDWCGPAMTGMIGIPIPLGVRAP